jgi:hypothetical protein
MILKNELRYDRSKTFTATNPMYVTIPLQCKKYSTTDNASSLVKSLNSSQIDSNSSPILGFVVSIDDCHSDACLPACRHQLPVSLLSLENSGIHTYNTSCMNEVMQLHPKETFHKCLLEQK